ncbi:antitoxin VapB family protein [Candidatus Woesearchaeota archaeon]|nr:antitoxin VapB family protein [Candidatus Woesearchaeota archaeon]
MVTKTLTIMEDAYELLVQHKQEDESFSEEIRRLLDVKKSKKTFKDLFGLLSEEEGGRMLKDLENIKKMNLKLLKTRLKNEGFG